MQLQHFNDTFTSVLDLVGGFVPPIAIAYCGGHLYGTLYNTDQIIASRAFAISIFIHYIFQTVAHSTTEGEKNNPKTFYVTQILGVGTLGMIQILMYRRLHLIGTRGTAIFATFILLGSLTFLKKLGSC